MRKPLSDQTAQECYQELLADFIQNVHPQTPSELKRFIGAIKKVADHQGRKAEMVYQDLRAEARAFGARSFAE